MGDFNADSYPDLAISVKSSNSVWVYLNLGSGTFGAPGKYATGSMPGQLAVGDINPYGRLDIVVVTAVGLSALQGNGNGTFKVAVNSTGASGGTLALGDVNRDGHLDVVVVGGSPMTVSYLGSGDGHFVKTSYEPPTGNLEESCAGSTGRCGPRWLTRSHHCGGESPGSVSFRCLASRGVRAMAPFGYAELSLS